jgi:nicotinamide-nucleotide amidase
MRRVTVMSTGNELLYGKTPDTNSSNISGKLFILTIGVRMHLAVGDDTDELEHAFRYALDRSDIVIVTGGLGPTDDDNTIEALRRIFGFQVGIDEQSSGKMQNFFREMGMTLSASDRKMVEVPRGSRVLANVRGLAPGFVLNNEKKIVIAMPGVPGEMEAMMEGEVIPYLIKECGLTERPSHSFRVIGMRESEINDKIKHMNIDLEEFEWGMTAKQGIATVTFVGKRDASADFDRIASEAVRLFGGRLLVPAFERPEAEIIHLMRERGMTLAVAESCTGGLISKRLTDIPGSSDVFIGCVVAYRNTVKSVELGVSEERLSRFGAVSEEVASDMAAGVRIRLGADIGISVTGIAGPGGGSEVKPVGTVCFCLSDSNGTSPFLRRISGNRERVREFASLIAVENLRNYLKQGASEKR